MQHFTSVERNICNVANSNENITCVDKKDPRRRCQKARMKEETNEVLDKEQWKIEAQAIIDDVKHHVTDIKVSEKLQNNQFLYLNLTTLEGLKFCIELSSAGFAVVGNDHDDRSQKSDEHFETPYSLLDFVSPQYRNSFSRSLVDKLKKLSDNQ